jgi:hypothetical protein
MPDSAFCASAFSRPANERSAPPRRAAWSCSRRGQGRDEELGGALHRQVAVRLQILEELGPPRRFDGVIVAASNSLT